MNTLNVDLGDRSYPIYIGKGLLQQASLVEPYVSDRKVLIVSNETVAPLYLDQTLQLIGPERCETLILADGEEHKNLTTLNTILDTLLKKRFSRNDVLVALGGGVIGDMTGFAAAIYQRGVPFIQIPTTLLAQVDSSVGGKTGVNHPLGKNMIGAFHQPLCVLADTNTLNTLADRQLSAGIAEVIKYGLIRDADFFQWLEANLEALVSRDSDALSHAILVSCQCKANIVSEDEKESGVRALLNLGHTFGHAIETGCGYGQWLHGEAVAAGMYMAAELSQRHGWIDDEAVERIDQLLMRAALPTRGPKTLDADQMLELMAVDKKVISGQLRLVLLNAIGDAFISSDFDPQKLRETLTTTTG